MNEDDDVKISRKWAERLLLVGIFGVPLALILYLNQSNELKETERYSRFQSFLMDCDCKPSGTIYTVDGEDETQYRCNKTGGTVSLSEYAEVIDEFYDPREQKSTRLCPEP